MIVVMAVLSLSGCADRRARLVASLADARLDIAVITDVRDCYYFTGALIANDLRAVLIARADGNAVLVCPEGYEAEGVDRVASYSWNHRGTRHPDPLRQLVAAVVAACPNVSGKRLGVQFESLPWSIARALEQAGAAELVGIDEAVAAMQRRKDDDELDMIRASVLANLAAYAAVAEAIAPGVNELDVLSAGRQGATRAAGEKVFHDGDYQCGAYNGPARDRPIERGELYIVDAWTCYRGYWSDMSRTFVVGVKATDAQQALFDHIRWVQTQVPSLLRPGVDGTQIYRALDEMIRQHPPLADEGLIHHGGHAIGLRIHEMPDINLERGGELEAGNIICIEPGGYFAAARHGVRLENMYFVTGDGCEDLCPGEIRLAVCC
jgi:Xaa-Pro aminopeptidase